MAKTKTKTDDREDALTGEVPDGPILDPQSLPAANTAVAAPPLELPRVIAIANQKGGVGKTTTAVNLGAALAELGFRVLVVDLDPQGNATTGLGLNPRDVAGSIYDVILNDTPLEDCIEPTSIKNLFVPRHDRPGRRRDRARPADEPGAEAQAGARLDPRPLRPHADRLPAVARPAHRQRAGRGGRRDRADPVRVLRARRAWASCCATSRWCRPTSTRRSTSAGSSSRCTTRRTKLADQVVTEVRAYFGAKVYETVVPRTVRLSEAPSFGQPIIVFDSTSRGAKAYRDLAKEVSRGATRRAG